MTVTDLAIRNVVYTPAGQDPDIAQGVLIASYAWEQDSMAYSMLDRAPADRPGDRRPVHDPPPGSRHVRVRRSRTTGRSTRYAGGIGPLFRPYEMTSAASTTTSSGPVGRVWFANDACDQRGRRWIEGAIAAAIKNAFAIHTGMRDELPVAPEA